MNSLVSNNLEINEISYKVTVRAIICDAPARAMVMGIKHHTGYSCCHMCQQVGEWKNGRMTFPVEHTVPRTDADFREKIDKAHHRYMSEMAMEKLPIDVVQNFPFDYMHVVCLGVMKSLFKAWLRGKNNNYTLSADNSMRLNGSLQKLKSHIPKEFCRKPRDLKEMERFKATEFRQFLLYTGPVALRDVLSQERYEHF